jgi:hypothetical protein
MPRSTNPHGPRGGLWPVLFVGTYPHKVRVHKEGLCASSGDINRLMMTHMMDCDQTAVGLPAVKSAIFLVAN